MINRYTKLRFRRKIRHQKKKIEKVSKQTGDHFEANVLNRWRNLRNVRRFVTGWLVLISLLIFGVVLQTRELDAYHLAQVPVSGGTFREGVVGEITNMNPIFATNGSDRAAAKLMFSSLFKYDADGEIIGDLATEYKTNKDGTIVTVQLRQDVYWHDGEPFNADDVVFTYEAIQHPDTRSYLNVAWRDVAVQAKGDYRVTFALPNPFTPFIHSLTQGGIIPEHILGSLDPAQIRGDEFNTNKPVGTGPFKFSELLGEATETVVNERQLRLDSYLGYHEGKPKLDHFTLATFSDREVMIERFLEGELAAVGGLTTSDRQTIIENPSVVWNDLPLNNIVYMFYKTTEQQLQDVKVRRALNRAIDQIEIQQVVDGRFAILDGPILPNQLGFNRKYLQDGHDLKAANRLLSEAGFKYKKGENNDGFRYKGENRLRIQLVTQNSDDYPIVARTIKTQWKKVGVDARVRVASDEDIQGNHISPHNYDALLFGVAMGADPDSFVYWHSSQSGVNGFNLSEIENVIIDEALESGRTRADEELRVVKYETFLKKWKEQVPATALFRPGYSYAHRRAVDGFEVNILNTPEQRYNSAHLWRINTREGAKPY